MEQKRSNAQFSLLNAQFSLPTALAAGLCWSAAIALLLLGNLHTLADPLAPQRLVYYAAVLLAGLFTFVPVQRRLELPGLAFEGVGGSLLLCYALAFVPPPSGWLFSLPDLPVYTLLIAALFWTVSALALPLVYAASMHIFSTRARQLDLRRARRQAHEAGALVAVIAGLASLRVLTWISLLLLALIIVIGELLFLSRVEAQ
jgi:hypothetical protein